MPNKTPWFGTRTKPVRIGVYEVNCAGIYSHWNGERWGYRMFGVLAAFTHRHHAALGRVQKWRGLSSAVHRKGRR